MEKGTRNFLLITSLILYSLPSFSSTTSRNHKSFLSLKKSIKTSFLLGLSLLKPTLVLSKEAKTRNLLRGKKERGLRIIEEDSRIIAEGDPSNFIGKTPSDKTEGMTYCTAFLLDPIEWDNSEKISILITNGHCPFTEEKDTTGESIFRYISEEWKETFSFKQDYRLGFSKAESSWKFSVFPKDYALLEDGSYAHDWTILGLEKNLGDGFKIESRGYGDYKEEENVATMGYSADLYSQWPGEDNDCYLKGIGYYENSPQVLHNCSTTGGASGSPIYVYKKLEGSEDETLYPTVVAIHHAHAGSEDETKAVPYSLSTANLAIATDEVFEVYEWLKANKGDTTVMGEESFLPSLNKTIQFNKKYAFIYNQKSTGYMVRVSTYVIGGAAGAFSSIAFGLIITKCVSYIKKKLQSRKILSKKAKNLMLQTTFLEPSYSKEY